MKPHLALTIGDPAGIGPEVVLKALQDPTITESCHLTVFGSADLLPCPLPAGVDFYDIPCDGKITPGKGDGVSGRISFLYLQAALEKTLKGEFAGIVTGPIAKSCWQLAGYNYPGQTEVLARAAGVEKYGMMFVARSPHTGWILRTLLATTHIPLSRVPTALNPELMSLKLELLLQCLRDNFQIANPTIVIAGLNPHSGEEGQLGVEEQEWLLPWLEGAKKQYRDVRLIGLVPPDTMWVKPGMAWFGSGDTENAAHAYLALYHDQGLIPVKLMAFDQAINTTIGLPFIRTSPDHGTAFDIASKGIARADSMKAAIELGAELARNKKLN
ncbi:MAG: D-threonate 4-phosphate dehydrogenase [Chroococcopsis gigantea SAG 12.99]|jgi:4-hydroxythreonine-4-phosphate dehydrogenase|nr:4-hydroxythreonine-4-phosphate dehydrogenase PdxA [Chlorogloea purpurea SAG 13.99]MDV3001490.1 D-threonate 4-phosphate dehydrogenase [Chroococcopsis gigantea SAG 12.99]